MATRDQFYLRCLILLYVCINNKIFLCTISPHGKPCCPYSYTNKVERGSRCLCVSHKLFLELIWWEQNLHCLTTLLYRYALLYFTPRALSISVVSIELIRHTFAPEHLNIHYWFYCLKVKMLLKETWKTNSKCIEFKDQEKSLWRVSTAAVWMLYISLQATGSHLMASTKNLEPTMC